MSSAEDQQNGQSVKINPDEARALQAVGIDPAISLPAPGVVLSERQAAFVAAYVQVGGSKALTAAASGYSEAHTAALLRLPAIQAAIKREQALAVSGLVLMADSVLSEILMSKTSDDKTRIAAARVAYERGGVLKRAALEAEKELASGGNMAAMSVSELERTIAEAQARIDAKAAGEPVDLVPDAEGAFSPAPQPAESA